jgi:uncharacterized protein
MALKEDLALLYRLQQADSNLARAQQELGHLDDGSRAARRAHAAQAAAEAAARLAREGEGRLKDRELALEGTETERKNKAQRSMSGSVTDSKELAALERKIAELDRRKGVLEEEVLGLYESVEALRAAETEAKRVAHERVLQAKRLRAEFQERQQALEQEVPGLTATRAELAAQIPAPLLAQYDKLRQKNQGVGVAAIANGSCTFCGTRLPNELVTMARSAAHLTRCESCGSILILE